MKNYVKMFLAGIFLATAFPFTMVLLLNGRQGIHKEKQLDPVDYQVLQQMLAEGRITSGHARALLGVSDPQQQLVLAQKVEQEKLSVREIEKAVKLLGREKKEKKKSQVDEAVELVFQDMENRMKTVMGTKVNISRKDKTKGKVEIEYYSEAELERIVELIESIQPM